MTGGRQRSTSFPLCDSSYKSAGWRRPVVNDANLQSEDAVVKQLANCTVRLSASTLRHQHRQSRQAHFISALPTPGKDYYEFSERTLRWPASGTTVLPAPGARDGHILPHTPHAGLRTTAAPQLDPVMFGQIHCWPSMAPHCESRH